MHELPRKELLDVVPVGLMDRVRGDREVVVDKLRRVGVVGVDPAHLRSRYDRIIGSLGGEEFSGRLSIAQVKLSARAGHDVLMTLRLQRSNQATTDEATDDPPRRS